MDEAMSAGETTALGGACQTEYEVLSSLVIAPQAGDYLRILGTQRML